MTRDQMIREARERAGSWQAVLLLYGIIVGTMVASGMAIV
jgi:hypothetical protein